MRCIVKWVDLIFTPISFKCLNCACIVVIMRRARKQDFRIVGYMCSNIPYFTKDAEGYKMADMNGEWKLISAENVKDYCNAIGTEPAYTNMALELLSADNDIRQKINIQGDNVSIITLMPGKTTDLVGILGEEINQLFLDGRKLKVVLSLEDGVLKEEQSGAFESSNVRYFDKEHQQLVMKMTAKGVTTTRKYEKVK